jgi:two-component system, NarL family, sensor histidine kinase BarA
VFKELGLKSRVLLLSLLPSSVLALALGGYFTWTQLSELQAQLLQRGQMISTHLAILAGPALVQDQPQQLHS